MKRYDMVDDDKWITEVSDGYYILFTDHEEEVKRAVAAEREEIAKWYAEEGWLLDEDDVAYAIRQRGEK